MKAYLKNYRQSPRKVRLVTDAVKGKRVSDALVELRFLPKRASRTVSKLIASAVANAENNFKVASDGLFIEQITVNQGVTLKRMMPKSRGMAHPINKRTSNIAVTLGTKKTSKKASTSSSKDSKSDAVKEPGKKKVAKKTTAKKAAVTTAPKKKATKTAAKKKPTTKKSAKKTTKKVDTKKS